MPAPTPISYNDFLANAQAEDIRALTFLSTGEVIRTPDPVEADAFQAQGTRLYDAGLLIRFRRGLEVVNGETWHCFDGTVRPEARNYVSQCAAERVTLSRDPLPAQ